MHRCSRAVEATELDGAHECADQRGIDIGCHNTSVFPNYGRSITHFYKLSSHATREGGGIPDLVGMRTKAVAAVIVMFCWLLFFERHPTDAVSVRLAAGQGESVSEDCDLKAGLVRDLTFGLRVRPIWCIGSGGRHARTQIEDFDVRSQDGGGQSALARDGDDG